MAAVVPIYGQRKVQSETNAGCLFRLCFDNTYLFPQLITRRITTH